MEQHTKTVCPPSPPPGYLPGAWINALDWKKAGKHVVKASNTQTSIKDSDTADSPLSEPSCIKSTVKAKDGRADAMHEHEI